MSLLRKLLLASVAGMLLSACTALQAAADGATKGVAQGVISAAQLRADYPLFDSGYLHTRLTEAEQAQVQHWPPALSVQIYFGTWCHDSQREVPKMLKILAERPDITRQLVALDWQKKDREGRAERAGVKYTPTFVINLAGKELGRIVERPNKSLIADISALLASAKSATD